MLWILHIQSYFQVETNLPDSELQISKASYFKLIPWWYLRVSRAELELVRLMPSEASCIRESSRTAAAKSLQSCPTLCDPIDGSPPGSPVPGILKARTLEWVAISFSNAWKWKVKVKSLSRVRLSATPWTAAFQTPPSMGFSRQEYWSGVPLPSPPVELVTCKIAGGT